MDEGARIAAAARALIGVRFRLHGRSAERGLDCVGLAALALERAGHRAEPPSCYSLRSGDVGRAEAWLRAAGLRPVGLGVAGDLALVRPGPVQLHLMLRVPGGHVHAHAGLGRVVETPGPSPWPVIGYWRIEQEGTGDGDIAADGGGHGAGRADWRGDRRAGGAGVRPDGAVRPQGTNGAAPQRPSGADVQLWQPNPEAVRDDARGGDGDLGHRPARDQHEERRRQGTAERYDLRLCGELRGGAVGAADPERAAHLGRRQSAARERGGFQDRIGSVPPASGRGGPAGRSADRLGSGAG